MGQHRSGYLLRRSIEEGEQVSSDIKRILELAEQNPGSSGGGGGDPSQNQSSGQSEGESKTDGKSNQRREGESTPELPGQEQQPKPGEPQAGGEQQGGEEPQPGDGKTPKDGQAQSGEPENRANDDPEAGESGERSAQSLARERWGELPQNVRDVFRQEGGEELPTLYRGYIDAWYEKLNKRASQR